MRTSVRVRSPRPLIPSRIPSGRGASEQPNAGHDEPPLTPTFWAMAVVTGIATGLLGVLMMLMLRTVEHVAFGYHTGSFGDAVAHASATRRLVVLMLAGAVGGVGWHLVRRLTAGQRSDLDDEVWTGTGELSFPRCFGSSVLSEMVVGAGASLGREAAPKLLGGAAGSLLARWRGLTPQQRRLLVACGGGAGMGAVYNVPLGGALITAELLYGSLSLSVILPALMTSAVATVVSWIYLPIHATYPDVPAYPLHATQVVFAFVIGPVIGLLGVGWVRLIAAVSHHQARGRAVLVAPVAAFTVLGLLAMRYPLLLGNGKDMAREAFGAAGGQALTVLLALAVLKPVVTALCLGSGATGGLFTPTMSTGAVLGLLLGRVWSLAWPGAPAGSYAVITAAALIGAAMQTPLAALALVIELTHTADTLIVPMIVAVALATAVVRYLDGYSIYSSRLPAREGGPAG